MKVAGICGVFRAAGRAGDRRRPVPSDADNKQRPGSGQVSAPGPDTGGRSYASSNPSRELGEPVETLGGEC